MFKIGMTAAAVSLGLITGAFAQSNAAAPRKPDAAQGGSSVTDMNATSSTSSGETMMMPEGWNGEIGSAFFSDATTGVPRTKEEAMANWAKLTPEQQAQVKSDCDGVRGPNNGSDKTFGQGSVEVCGWVNAM